MVGLAALVSCDSDATRPAVDTTSPPVSAPTPVIDFRVVRVTDSTARVLGTIRADAGIEVMWLRVEGHSQYRIDTIPTNMDRVVEVSIPIGPKPVGYYLVSFWVRDGNDKWGAIGHTWYAGPPTPRASFSVDFPDTLRQPGLEFTAHVVGPAALDTVRMVLDAGTPAQREVPVPENRITGQRPYEIGGTNVTVTIPPNLPNGPHTFTLRLVDDSLNASERTWTQVVSVPAVSYRAGIITSADGKALRVTDLNSRGDVSGIREETSTPPRAFVRTSTGLAFLGDSASSTAWGLNDAGDVVGSDGRAAVVWRDGTKSILRAGVACDITNDGRVLVVHQSTGYVLDPTGQTLLTFSTGGYFGSAGDRPVMNNLAHVATPHSPYSYGNYLTTYGFTVMLPPPRPEAVDRFGRGSWQTAIAVSDHGAMLGYMGDYFVATATSAEYVSQRLPGRVGHLSPSGEMVSVTGDSVFLWSSARGTRRVVISGADDWRPDSSGFGPSAYPNASGIMRLNASGVIAVNAVHRTTGQRGILLLKPEP